MQANFHWEIKVQYGCRMSTPPREHLRIIYDKCDGKERCEFETTDNFFKERSSCSREKGLWMKYR